PISPLLLHDKRNCVRPLLGGSIQRNDSITARREIRNYKFCAVGSLSRGPKYSTKKLRLGGRRRSLFFQHERRTCGPVSSGKARLILLDGVFEACEIAGEAG